jgi:hypothetical protein
VAVLDPAREQHRIAADFAENLRLLQAATAVPEELVDLLQTMRGQIADLQARVAALEVNPPDGGARPDLAESEDGSPMPGGHWHPIKAAASMAGFASETSLRKHMAKYSGTRPWWWYRAGRLWVDLNRAPRKRQPA